MPRILLVEDAQDQLDLVSMALMRHGWQVEVASRADEALERLAERRYDLVISHLGLPDRKATTMLAEARAAGRLDSTAVLIVTGQANPDNPEGFPVLAKPLDLDLLVRQVRSILGGAARADTIKLADGSRVNGRAKAYDAGTKVLSFHTDDGRDVTYRLDQLDARSVYQVTRSEVPKESGRGQLQLANFARDAELWAHAVRHYGWAVQADPSLQEEVDREVGVE